MILGNALVLSNSYLIIYFQAEVEALKLKPKEKSTVRFDLDTKNGDEPSEEKNKQTASKVSKSARPSTTRPQLNKNQPSVGHNVSTAVRTPLKKYADVPSRIDSGIAKTKTPAATKKPRGNKKKRN